jgi:uncharacterized protein YjbI with pentapeptide repeats
MQRILIHCVFILVGYDGARDRRHEERKVDQERKPRERSFIGELVPRWRPTSAQVLWAVRITVAVILALTVVALLGVVLWVVLGIYINPRTATERKDLVQSFAIVAAGVVGSLSALAAVGNLYISSRNLRQERELELERAERERELENRRAQEDALPAYLDQMVQLLNDENRPLRQAAVGDEVSILARVRTLTVLPRLDGSRKGSVMQFLYEAGLIHRKLVLVDLTGADLRQVYLHEAMLPGADLGRADMAAASLSQADLSEANLNETDLSEANLNKANLSGANLRRATLLGANLSGANLSGANLSRANLSRANLSSRTNLSGANLSGADLPSALLSRAYPSDQAPSLKGAIMPNGQKYEDWLKSNGKGEK